MPKENTRNRFELGDAVAKISSINSTFSPPLQQQTAKGNVNAKISPVKKIENKLDASSVTSLERFGTSPFRVGVVVRTYQGIIEGVENHDPDGMNPSRGEAQVCWLSGAVENVLCNNLTLVDRSFTPGSIVSRTSQLSLEKKEDLGEATPDFDGVINTYDQALPAHSSIEDSLASSKYEPALALLAKMFPAYSRSHKGIVLSVKQLCSIRLLNPVKVNETYLTHTPLQSPLSPSAENKTIGNDVSSQEIPDILNNEEDKASCNYSITTPYLDQSMEGTVHIRDVYYRPGLTSIASNKNDSVRALLPISEGDTVVGFGWLGVVERVKIQNAIRLLGGLYFKKEGYVGARIRSSIIRCDPGYLFSSSELFPFFPLQKIQVTSHYIDVFQRQLSKLTSVPSVAEDSEKSTAIKDWLKDVASTNSLSRGEIISLETLGVRVRWLAPMSCGSRKIPNRVIRPQDVLPLHHAPMQVGQPVYVSNKMKVKSALAMTSNDITIESLLQQLNEDKKIVNNDSMQSNQATDFIGIIDSIQTYCTILWDTGKIETGVLGKELKVFDCIEYAGAETLSNAYTLMEKENVPQITREAFLDYALHECIFHPYNIVRKIKISQDSPSTVLPSSIMMSTKSYQSSIPFNGFEDVFEEHSRSHQARMRKAENSCLNSNHHHRHNNSMHEHDDEESISSSSSSSLTSSSPSVTSVLDSSAPLLNLNVDTEEKQHLKGHDSKFHWPPLMNYDNSIGLLLNVNQPNNEGLVSWLTKDELDNVLEKKKALRQSKQHNNNCQTIISTKNNKYPLIEAVQLCMCPISLQHECPAFQSNIQCYPIEHDLDNEWRRRLYDNALQETNTVINDHSTKKLERVRLGDIMLDRQASLEPGFLALPTGLWLNELQRWFYNEAYDYQEEALPLHISLGMSKFASSRYFSYELLVSTGFDIWVRMIDGQVLHLFTGEVEKMHTERAVMQLNISEDWYDDDEDDDDDDEDDLSGTESNHTESLSSFDSADHHHHHHHHHHHRHHQREEQGIITHPRDVTTSLNTLDNSNIIIQNNTIHNNNVHSDGTNDDNDEWEEDSQGSFPDVSTNDSF